MVGMPLDARQQDQCLGGGADSDDAAPAPDVGSPASDRSPQAEAKRGNRPQDAQSHQAGLLFGHQPGHREDEQHVGEVRRQGDPVEFQLALKHM